MPFNIAKIGKQLHDLYGLFDVIDMLDVEIGPRKQRGHLPLNSVCVLVFALEIMLCGFMNKLRENTTWNVRIASWRRVSHFKLFRQTYNKLSESHRNV